MVLCIYECFYKTHFFSLQNTFLMGNRYVAKLLCETVNNLDYVGK